MGEEGRWVRRPRGSSVSGGGGGGGGGGRRGETKQKGTEARRHYIST